MIQRLLPAITLLIVFGASQAWSQDRGRFDPSEILARMDANSDGLLTQSEISSRAERFINDLAKRAGLNPGQPMPIKTLINTAKGQSDRGRDDDRDRDRDRDRRSRWDSKDEEPIVPGFGVDAEMLPPPGFDVDPNSPLASRVPLEERYDKEILKTVEDMLRRYDRDGSGAIEKKEYESARWRTNPNSSDLNKDGKLNKVELCERIAGFQGNKLATKSTSSRSSSSSGFGADSKKSSSGSGSSSSSSDSSDKIKKYAESLMRQYDRNKNRILEKEEWKNMRGSPEESDLNKDGKLTLAELTHRLKNYSRSSSSSSSSSSSDKKSSDSKSSSSRYSRYKSSSSKKDDDDDSASYRFLTPAERLPKDLPSWFARNDADADGQVKMAEYSTVWTDDKVEEFRQIDANGDGFITPAEAIAAESK